MTKQSQVTALETKVIELVQSSANVAKIADKNNSLILDTALLYNVVIFKIYPKGATPDQMQKLNKIHLGKLNKNTMQKVSSLANRTKINDIISKCKDKDLDTVKKAVEKATGEKSLAKIKKATKNDTVEKKPSTDKVKKMPLTDEMKTSAEFIQWFLAQSPSTQYKIITFAFNLKIDPKDTDNVIPKEFLNTVISLVPQLYTPALIEAS
tara:strand:+ start:107 stop:733 length:627 start_codon:yes stop_codon:yes gene_type:complete